LNKRGGKLRLPIFVALLVLVIGYFGIGSVNAAGLLLWTQVSNPSGLTDTAIDVAVAPSGVYTVGYDMVGGNSRWRIERRSLVTGALLAAPVAINPSGGSDIAYAVAVDGTGVYVAGYDSVGGNARWRIEKRNLFTLAPIWVAVSNPSAGTDIAFDVAVRATGVYIVGSIAQTMWRIERRSLINGALLAAPITINPSGGSDIAYAVAVDGTGVYVAGYDSVGGNPRWRIEKRTLLGLAPIWTVASNPSVGNDMVYDIAVSPNGVYIVGYDSLGGNARWRIERRSLVNGALLAAPVAINPSGGSDIAFGVAVGATGIYVVGVDRAVGNNGWRIEKRTLLGLAPILPVVVVNPSGGDDGAKSVAVDVTGIYTVGYDQVLGNLGWRMEKRTP